MNEVSQLRRLSAIEHLRSDGWLVDVDWFAEIDSTNNFLKRELVSDASKRLPMLTIADRQTAGRGRGPNAWWSPSGCLMFSLAWRPDHLSQMNPIEIQAPMSQLPLVVGIAIAIALQQILVDRDAIKVKWPNDIYIGSKKVCGILIESVIGNSEPYWIVGVGMNVLVDIESAPEPIRSNATSIHRECRSDAHGDLCLESVLISIIQRLRDTLNAWQTNRYFLQQSWPDYCLLTDRSVEIQQTDRRIQGICCGIDERGALLVLDERGQQHAILSGVVQSW